MSLKAKLDERAKLVTAAREILDAAGENGLSSEQEERFHKIDGQIDDLTSQIDTLRDIQERRSKLSSIEDLIGRDEPVARDERSRPVQRVERTSEQRNAELRSFIGHVMDNPHKTFEMRAMAIGDADGGATLVAEEFARRIVETMDDMSVIRRISTVIQTAGDHTIPIETAVGTAAWEGEGDAYADTNPTLGSVKLGAFKAATLVKVSEELIQDEIIDLEAYLSRAFARRLVNLEETAFANGPGTTTPTGLVSQATANNKGAAGATAITADELIDVYHNLPEAYRRNASWIMNDSTIALIRKLKDGDSQYLWQPGLQAGQPDLLLGRPIYSQLGMPAATTGNVSVLFGDFSYVVVGDRGTMGMQRLNELYAANGQVGFRVFKRVDCKLTNTDAFAKLTQA